MRRRGSARAPARRLLPRAKNGSRTNSWAIGPAPGLDEAARPARSASVADPRVRHPRGVPAGQLVNRGSHGRAAGIPAIAHRHRVEVLVRYSNIARESEHIKLPVIERTVEPRSEPEHRPARHIRATTRLGAAGIAALVADYVAGASASELTTSYDISKPTVLKLLDEHGVTRRRRYFTASDRVEAARLYSSGLSVQAVGERLGFSAKTIWTALREDGVNLRDCHGRER